MTSLAMPDGTPRHDVLCWGVCFAVAAAAHAAAVVTLLRAPPSSDADFVAGTPLVMIDLPATPAPASAPPTNLPPGPQETPSEQAPPPKEETKPPEQVAEVALPEPEPPPATAPLVAIAEPTPAPPTAGVDAPSQPQPPSATVRRWQSGLVAQIARLKRYPAKARARLEQGVVRIAFTIDRAGRVVESRVVESSGSADLDREFMSMLARAQPLPKPPDEAQATDLSFMMGMQFGLQ
jgi:protein TonB